MNTSEFLIETSDLELAQKIGETISDKSLRNRAVASVFAVNIASKYFDTEKYDIDTVSGLHNIPKIHSDIDISDIYVNGNYIDVRIFFEGDTPSIPCSLINNNILPVAFLFIKVDSEFSNAEVIGFIRPEDIDQKNIYNNQILIEETSLTSFYDVEPFLINNEEFIEIDDSVLDDYLIGKKVNDNNFFENLTKSKDARLRLAKLAKAQYIFNFVSLSQNSIPNNIDIEQTELEPIELNTIDNNENNFNLGLDSDISMDFSSEISVDNDSDLKLSSESSIDFDSEISTDNDFDLELNPESSMDFDSEISMDNDSDLELSPESSMDFDSEISMDNDSDLELNPESSMDFDSEISMDNDSDLELSPENSIDFNSEINMNNDSDLELSPESSMDFGSEISMNNDSDLELSSESSMDFDSEINMDNDSDLELSPESSIDFDSEINMNNDSDLELSSESSMDFDSEISMDNNSTLETNSKASIDFASNDILLENNEQEIKTDESSDVEILQKDIQQIDNDHMKTDFNNNFKTITTPNLLEELEKENTLGELQKDVNINSENINNNNESTQEEIDSLFTADSISENSEQYEEENKVAPSQKNKKNSKVIPIIGLITLLGGLGYLIYSKIVSPSDIIDNNTVTNNIIESSTQEKKDIEEAMPIETVETNNTDLNNRNEGIGTSVPAIEQNLDASILVSNLKVDWEVPTGYASNTSAKRYLIKLGKILQLNLKTELLLLNKPPITNKIGVEIKFNENTKKFEPVGITISSGEESVDNIILNTVKNTLGMNFSTNINSISKLQGNPVLIIHL